MPQNDTDRTAIELKAYKSANLAICVTDEAGLYVSVNEKYATLFGYEPLELIGSSFLKVIPSDSIRKTEETYFELIKNVGMEIELGVTRVRKDGTMLFLSATYSVMQEGGRNYVISTVKDITEQRTQEERQMLQQRLLLQQSKLTALAEMMSAIAHQWRQPLNALGIMIQDIKIARQFGELNDEYLDNFDASAMKQVKTMSKTIDDFRNFFKPDNKKEDFALISATLDVVSLINPQLEHYGIATNVYSPLDIDEPGEALIHGYPNEFKQLVLNILSNSKDAIVEKKEKDGEYDAFINVEIGVASEDGNRYAFARVIDNGSGIDPKVLPRVFEPYFTTKEQGKGTGVGLYMTKMIIEQNMGGTITATNRQGGGAIFEIRFGEGKGVFVG